MAQDDIDVLRGFVFARTPKAEFEAWLYNNKHLQTLLGERFHEYLITFDYRNDREIYVLRQTLETWLREHYPLACECLTLSDLAAIQMGSDRESAVLSTLKKILHYGDKRWWLCERIDQRSVFLKCLNF